MSTERTAKRQKKQTLRKQAKQLFREAMNSGEKAERHLQRTIAKLGFLSRLRIALAIVRGTWGRGKVEVAAAKVSEEIKAESAGAAG